MIIIIIKYEAIIKKFGKTEEKCLFKLLLSKFEATPVDINKVMMVVVCLFRPQCLGRLYQVGPFKNFQNKKCSPDPKRCYWFKPCFPKALYMTYCSCTWSGVAMFWKVWTWIDVPRNSCNKKAPCCNVDVENTLGDNMKNKEVQKKKT